MAKTIHAHTVKKIIKIFGCNCYKCGDKLYWYRQLKKAKVEILSYDKAYVVFRTEEDKIKKSKRLTVDHIIPRSMGGTNRSTNLRPCCYECNFKKNKYEQRIMGIIE